MSRGDSLRVLSTRLSFLVAGLVMASWAPQVPYAKARLGLDESAFGLLLLCLGIGSVLAMQVIRGGRGAYWNSARHSDQRSRTLPDTPVARMR
jgi:hypothetical protein